MKVTESDINAYLCFGYLPNLTGPTRPGILDRIVGWLGKKSAAQRDAYRTLPYDQLIRIGRDAFQTAISSYTGGGGSGLHVVPLSGGLDSRAILAELLRLGLRENIIAVTFGTPGTLDYELGRLVAARLAVKHECVNLETVDINTNVLLRTIQQGAAWTYTFDAYFNSLVRGMFGSNVKYWSGPKMRLLRT